MRLHGARCAMGPRQSVQVSLELEGGSIRSIGAAQGALRTVSPTDISIDLGGFLILPGLINAHDHLQFALFPRLGEPPYRNYIEWGEDIHATSPAVIATHKAVAKSARLWWGGLRNLLCGVTTVCHHDPIWPELLDRRFPVRIARDCGWAHSYALGGDVARARTATPKGRPFFVHACEGVDDLARNEIFALDRAGVLDEATVLIHGLALDRVGIALVKQRQASLVVCPSSNEFLFSCLPDMDQLSSIQSLALGSDSPLTAAGDLLDEARFALERCDIAPEMAYHMVTAGAANVLRLPDAGKLRTFAPADLVAIRDTGADAADRLSSLSMHDVELVMIGGTVQLVSDEMRGGLPAEVCAGLEPLWIDGAVRWLRAPVATLLGEAEMPLGHGQVRLGGRLIALPDASVGGDIASALGNALELAGT